MKLKLYSPASPLLKKYIECIYILKQTAKKKQVNYITFPTTFAIVTINKNSKISQQGNKILIEQSDTNKIETKLACNFNKPVCVQYRGKINEITIYFKPLGINAFLDKELNHYSKAGFSDFSPFEDYKIAMLDALSLTNDAEKIKSVERYWLSKLKGFDHDFLESILEEIMSKRSPLLTIAALSRKNGISRTTLNKHFDRHICKTPSQFKRILRFRNAIKKYLATKYKCRLTDIAYNIDYFDQSHMIKDFKSLTGYSPKDFFSKTAKLENVQISWLFV